MSAQNWNHFQRAAVLDFVRKTVAAELGVAPEPGMPDVPGLAETGACFVTLHGPAGALRGCIGNLEAFETLGENLKHNALNAAFRDPRFPMLEPEELEEVKFEVSVLSAPESISGAEAFETGRHGIILRKSGRSAVFLPQVAPEQGWDRETTLNYLAIKAGLPPDAWREPDAEFSVFTATVLGE